MKRVLIVELKQETSTFNPAPTTYEDFRIHRGDELMTSYANTKTELAGAFDIFSELGGVELVPAMAAAAVSGGPIGEEDLNRLLNEIIDLTKDNLPLDGAYLCLHGAMAGESENDPEGRLLTELRKVIGEIPMVASIDLHAIITDQLLIAADILVPYHTYPHIDHYQTGQRSAQVLLSLLRGEVCPSTARVALPMLVRGDELMTETGKFGEAIRMCQEIEASSAGLAAGVIIGNAFTDVPGLQSNVLVTTDGDMNLAQSEAEKIGRFMWDHRELFQAELTGLADAIQFAEDTEGLTVFSDAADATASGASGDSNEILRGLIEHSFSKSALIPIVDAPAVAAAFKIGDGAIGDFQLGGTCDPGRFQPENVNAQVMSLHQEGFTYEDGTEAAPGRAAVLLIDDRWTILVTEKPVFVVGQKVFQAYGLEPAEFDLVVVKSPNGFRPWYDSIATRIVPVDVPGSTSANLKSLPYHPCIRPIFPLDDDARPPFI